MDKKFIPEGYNWCGVCGTMYRIEEWNYCPGCMVIKMKSALTLILQSKPFNDCFNEGK